MTSKTRDSSLDRQTVLAFLGSSAYRPMKAKEIARSLKISQGEYPRLRALLRELESAGEVYRVKRQRYALPQKINLVVGHLQMTRRGRGFVVPEGEGEEVLVTGAELSNALHGDKVVVRVEAHRRRGESEGTIIKVLERAHPRIVGSYSRSRHFGVVAPDHKKIHRDIYVAPRGSLEAREGQKVVIEVDDWGTAYKNPEGHVVEILGDPDEPGVDVQSIIRQYNLPDEFPSTVEREASQIPRQLTKDVLAGRLDLRGHRVFTIDPVDAKDFDDALSIALLRPNLFQVGVHIADVTHYLGRGTAMDREALARATSVYLVDRAIPMLPELLSADLCSLKPGEDRPAFSVLFTVEADGTVRDYRFADTVIRSQVRLTYEEAQHLLGEPPRAGDRYRELAEDLHRLRALSHRLYEQRARRGSLDFDLPEARVLLDAEGFPQDIQRVVRLDSHRLIEELMILANEAVAQHLLRHQVPTLYRVHESPDPARLKELSRFIAAFGYQLPLDGGKISPRVLQRLLHQVEDKPEESLISTVVLRSLKRAHYAAENIGHFGLASRAYTHFTSPIRRYPDVVVHRVLRQFLQRPHPPPDLRILRGQLKAMAEHCSERERVAEEAERESVTMKKVEFMVRHLGQEFSGIVSGVTSFGFFVLLDDYFVEGLVHVNSLEDDYYQFREEHYALIGEHTGRMFRLADRVRVQAVKVSKEEREIDFLLLEGGQPARRGRVRRQPQTPGGRARRHG